MNAAVVFEEELLKRLKKNLKRDEFKRCIKEAFDY